MVGDARSNSHERMRVAKPETNRETSFFGYNEILPTGIFKPLGEDKYSKKGIVAYLLWEKEKEEKLGREIRGECLHGRVG